MPTDQDVVIPEVKAEVRDELAARRAPTRAPPDAPLRRPVHPLHPGHHHNQIAEKLRTAFFEHYRRVPSPNEVQSWQNSLRATAMVFQEAELDDHVVILEHQLPLSSRRLDCIVTGHDRAAGANAVIVELNAYRGASPSVVNYDAATGRLEPERAELTGLDGRAPA